MLIVDFQKRGEVFAIWVMAFSGEVRPVSCEVRPVSCEAAE